MRILVLLVWIWTVAATTVATSSDLSALARVLPEHSVISDRANGVDVTLALSQGVPYRVFTLDGPRRLVLDFNEVDWAGLDLDALDQSTLVSAVQAGVFRPGWSRIILNFSEPFRVETAVLDTSNPEFSKVALRLIPSTPTAFSKAAGAPQGALYAMVKKAVDLPVTIRRQNGEGPLVVVLDPGHGGIDPGAENDGAVEADLMLQFARELEEILVRAGNFKVVLTRKGDDFVPLETRVSIARQAGADAFLSLHADALAEGRASGATVYTLSDAASDIASQKLAERHDRADLLVGIDLTDQDDAIATVLMELARRETRPRSDALAKALVTGLTDTVGMHKRPHLSAGFSVLKAPDIPSVLVEVGFLSSPRDRKRILDPEWRLKAATGIRNALQSWAISDAAEAELLRR